MKKIIAAVAGVAVVIYLAAPFVIGVIAQRQFPRIVQAANTVGTVQWKAGRFQRGYRHSSAETTLRIPLAGQSPLVIDLQHHITQGLGPDLSIAVVTTTPVVHGKAKQWLGQLLHGKAPLTIRTVIYADGHYTSTVAAPAVAYQPLPGNAATHVAFGGLSGTFSTGRTSRSTRYRLAVPSFEIENDKAQTKVIADGLTLGGHGRPAQDLRGLGVGKGTLTLAKVMVSTPSGTAAELDGIQVAAGSQIKSDGLDFEENIRIARLAAAPAFKATNVTFDFAASHLDGKSIESYASRSKSLYLHLKPAQTAAMRLQVLRSTAAMQVQILRSTAVGLLAHSPQVQIKRLGCDLPAGPVRLTANATFDGTGFQDLDRPAIIKRLSVHASLKAPTSTVHTLLMTALRPRAAALVKARKLKLTQAQLTALTARMAHQVIANLVARNLVRKEQGAYASSLDMNRGALTVNGQALALPSPPPGAH